jgi:hypothetical protein
MANYRHNNAAAAKITAVDFKRLLPALEHLC